MTMLKILSLSICISLFTAFSVIAQPIAYIGSNNNNNVSIVNVPTVKPPKTGPPFKLQIFI
jgi:hypothetical protein